MAQLEQGVLCATFDLQQAIHLPIPKENPLFYNRRLDNYNLTFYNFGACNCFLWQEGQSRRGSPEICTAVYSALKLSGIRKAYMFLDRCPSQNKSSIFPTMMLCFMNNSLNFEELSLRYFESFHGQNEGDSVHSTIATAMKHAGNVFKPCQLVPISKLARRKHPCSVHTLQSEDF